MPNYRVAPIFLVRVAGVPFEVLEGLGTPETSEAARNLLRIRREFEASRLAVEQILKSRGHGLSEELFHAWRTAVRTRSTPPAVEGIPTEAFATYSNRVAELALAKAHFTECLQRELTVARAALFESAQRILPPYLIFGAEGFNARIPKLLADYKSEGKAAPRNARARERDRLLLLYLQRLAAKNDTYSEFGPTAWGKIGPGADGIEFLPSPGIGKRQCFLERWTAHAAAAAMNIDPEIRSELAPRVHPNARIDGDLMVRTDTGETTELSRETIALLARCDGQTPAYALGVETGVLEELARKYFIRFEIEVPALDPHAFDMLVADVSQWREGTVRQRWLDCLQPIAALPAAFGEEKETAARREIMERALHQVEALGGARSTSQRALYAATNPIAEECSRDGVFRIDESMTDTLAREAEPWLELWRDTYAFVASRVARGLRGLFEAMSAPNGAVALPAFLRHCELNKMPLTGHGLVALAHMAFQEVKTEFRKMADAWPDAAEHKLTADDCSFVRRNFAYEKFDDYTYPSADLQISAASYEAAARGAYEWVVSELHPPIAMLHHCFFWSCPDTSALSEQLASSVFGQPGFHLGFFAADFTAHTTVRLFDAMPELTNFIAPQRAHSRWKTIPPAEVEVYVDGRSGDVCLRQRGSNEYLGSFARSWVIPLGFHPFNFGRAPHMPRLRCGNVTVQRESWTVRMDELAPGDYTGISSHLVLAVETLRSEKGWPRYVYIRPTEQALRRSGAEGRDKDTKPVFIDLESYLSLEIFHRWLKKAGELEVTEMLPDPDHLCWQEADGRRTFELRTLIVPRA